MSGQGLNKRVTLQKGAGVIRGSRDSAKAIVKDFESDGWEDVRVEKVVRSQSQPEWVVTCSATAIGWKNDERRSR